MNEFVAIMMGSKSDLEHAKKISEILEKFGIEYCYRIASAHKTTEHLLKAVKELDSKHSNLIYIAVAGRSNALCGVLDGNTQNPVITCPPYSEKFGGMDLLSSLRMPSGISCTTMIESEGAALAAVKILALHNPELKKKVLEYQKKNAEQIMKDDEEIRK